MPVTAHRDILKLCIATMLAHGGRNWARTPEFTGVPDCTIGSQLTSEMTTSATGPP